MAKRRRPPPPDPDDRIKFPFGETASQQSGESLTDSDLDSGDLDSEDLFGSDASEQAPGLLDPDSDEEDIGSDSQWSSGGSRLPGAPPDADPSDDLDFDTLSRDSDVGESGPFEASDSDADLISQDSLESLVELDSSEARRLSVSERIGPTNPSGPLVIVDDEGEASSRYQASILDDSARLAGSTSQRAGKKKKKKKKKGKKGKTSARKSRWEQEAYDEVEEEEVPFPEQRRRPRTPPPPKPSKIPMVVVGLLGLLAAGGVGVALEMKRQEDLRAQQEAFDERLAALEQKNADALAADRSAAKTELEKQKAELERERRAVLASAEEKIRQASEQARSEAEAKAARAQAAAVKAERERVLREQRSAVDVELARARREREAEEAERVRAAVDDALAKERETARKALEAAVAEAEAKRRREVRELERELRKEREAAASRAAEADVAESIAEDQTDLLDEVEGGDGGSVSEDVDDWDEFFEDDESATGGDDSGGDDWSMDGAEEEEGAPDSTGALLVKAYELFREHIHGKVGYKHLSHFSTGPNRNLRTTRHEVRAKLEWRPWLIANDDRSRGLKLVADADIRKDDDGFYTSVPRGIDDEERRRSTIVPNELSLALTIDWFEIKGGWQTFSWGTGDLFNPTDNLNPVDFSDQFDARRIAVLSASMNFSFEHVNLELISIPTFTRTRLPLRNRRFDTLQQSALPILNPEDPDGEFDDVQWAGKASTTVFGWDLSASVFRGYNDLPEPRFGLTDPSDPSSLVIDPVFDRITVAGADFATTLGIFGAEGALGEVLGGIQIHGEIAHFWNDSNEVEDYAQYVIGFNYQWVDLIFEHDVQLTLEYAGEFITDETDNQLAALQIDRALRGAILGRILYQVNDKLSFELNAALITRGPENSLVRPGINWTIGDHLEIIFASDLFFGPSDTFFGRYRRDRRVTTQVSIVF